METTEKVLEIMRNDLELVRTQNGMLPLMDLFVTLGKSGYANSFGESIRNINEDSYDALAGVNFEYPIYNRSAKARHRRADQPASGSRGMPTTPLAVSSRTSASP